MIKVEKLKKGDNVEMHDYTVESIKNTLFSSKPVGEIKTSKYWTSESLPWEKKKIAKSNAN